MSKVKTKKTVQSKLFEYFENSYVSIVVSGLNGSELYGDVVVQGSIAVSGILLEEDSEFVYLGDEEGNVLEALRKDQVLRVCIKQHEAIEGFNSEPSPDDVFN